MPFPKQAGGSPTQPMPRLWIGAAGLGAGPLGSCRLGAQHVRRRCTTTLRPAIWTSPTGARPSWASGFPLRGGACCPRGILFGADAGSGVESHGNLSASNAWRSLSVRVRRPRTAAPSATASRPCALRVLVARLHPSAGRRFRTFPRFG